MNEAFLSALEKNFGCHINGVKPRRNVLFVRTNRGNWVIKAYKDKEKAQWVTQLSHLLQENGFSHTVSYLQTEENGPVFPYGNHFYTIMKAIDGRESSYAFQDDIRQAALTLARFHRAARSWNPGLVQFRYKPPLIEKWETRLTEFTRIAERIAARGPVNRLESMIQSMAPEVLRDSRQVLEQSYRMPLIAEMHQAIEEGTVAHRDVASHNFLLTPSGECYLIDLDTAHFDMQLVDLVQFVGRMLLLQGYQPGIFTDVINAYSIVNPLQDNQIRMIHQLLRYPDNILREVTGVYSRRPGYRARGAMQLLQLEGRYRRQRNHFLRAEHQVMGSWSNWTMGGTG
ncbi:phosphotransferase [Brevibacillus humidisoli]|uniref:phosphotransferase n=1 Tax=Brevibacillus humidisoli TaxID=2895522 RepID=UPI001E5B44DA|nr:phosphotransferase [Brevibacillus humidisoli]UFJ39033.1 phosphotransferase [Brevibacillus humidisoli]